MEIVYTKYKMQPYITVYIVSKYVMKKQTENH